MSDLFSLNVEDFSNGSVVFRDLKLSIPPGSIIGLAGENGVGKTTLLKIMSGYIDANCQRFIHGKLIEKVDPSVQLIKHSENLLPWKTVVDNIRMAIIPETNYLAAREALEKFQIERLSKRWPANLSAGETRMVELARCMVNLPSLLLLDEPFNGLDIVNRKIVKEIVESKFYGGVVSIVFVSHDVAMLGDLCDLSFVLRNRNEQLELIECDSSNEIEAAL